MTSGLKQLAISTVKRKLSALKIIIIICRITETENHVSLLRKFYKHGNNIENESMTSMISKNRNKPQ